jgi:hypothetical protein
MMLASMAECEQSLALSAQRYEKNPSPPNDEPEFSVALSGERPAKDKKIKR